MKKMLLFIALGTMAAACSDDNNATVQNNPAAAIVGKWKIESIVVDNTTALDLNDCDTGTYKEFKNDNTLHEFYKCGTNTSEDISNYTISGNTITVVVANDPESPYIFNVTELNENLLTYTYAYEDEDNVDHVNKFTFSRIE